MKYLFIFLIFFTQSLLAQETVHNNISVITKKNDIFDKISNNILASYYLRYLGPSLSNNYQNGATYNRFETGQDFKGDDNDHTGSQQVYQAFKIGTKLPRNMTLSYGYTFQHNLYKGIKYETYNKDGSVFAVYEREQGYSANNHQISLFVPSIINNRNFFYSVQIVYERPTTESSRDKEMLFGFGLNNTIGLYQKDPRLQFGFSVNAQRDFYNRRQFYESCGSATCFYKRQLLRVSIGPYFNYRLAEKWQFKSSVIFDWDQQGEQIGGTQFNNNMDNVAEAGLQYQISRNLSVKGGLILALNQASPERNASFFDLSLNF